VALHAFVVPTSRKEREKWGTHFVLADANSGFLAILAADRGYEGLGMTRVMGS